MSEIRYNQTSWVNDVTPLNSVNMNNIEQGVAEIVDFINNLPSWVINGTKPTYTYDEVGADRAGAASDAVASHNASASAHINTLAQKVHYHTISDITNFPRVSYEDNKCGLVVVEGIWDKARLADVAFSGEYSDLINSPSVPTKTSDLTNDSGYITLDDVRRTAQGSWVGGYVSTLQTFNCGFLPSYITIVEKNSSGVTTSTSTINSTGVYGDATIEFVDVGFTIVSSEDGTFNKTNRTYSYVAVSDGFKSLPSVTVADNGKVLTVVNGVWVGQLPTKELPTVSAAENGKVLGVASGEWSIYTIPNQLPSVTSADEGKFLMVDSSGNWVAQAMSAWYGGNY